MAQEIARWEEVAFEGVGAFRGETVNLIPTVKNDTDQEITFLVAVLLGIKGVFWGTEPTMGVLSYPGGEDAAATGEFTFAPGEEKKCPLGLTIPEEAPRKTYDVWLMVFHGDTRVAERVFNDKFTVA